MNDLSNIPSGIEELLYDEGYATVAIGSNVIPGDNGGNGGSSGGGSGNDEPGATVTVRETPALEESGAITPDPTEDFRPIGGIGGRFDVYNPVRGTTHASDRPYRTAATFAAAACASLKAFERSYALSDPRRDGRNRPEFTSDIGKVAISLAEMLLRIHNPIIRRDFVSTFMSYLSAREQGYDLDYDAIPDLMEIWRTQIVDEKDGSVLTRCYDDMLKIAFETEGISFATRMRVP